MMDLDKFDKTKPFDLRDKRGSIEANAAALPFINKK